MQGLMMVGFPWAGMMHFVLSHGFCVLSVGLLSGIAWRSCKREKRLLVEVGHERRMREELEAYAKLDGAKGLMGSAKRTAKLVCRTVVEKSVFRRAAMLVCDAEGKLYVAGSAGMDDLAVEALRVWGEGAVLQDRGLAPGGPAPMMAREKITANSFLLKLDGPFLRAGRGCKRRL